MKEQLQDRTMDRGIKETIQAMDLGALEEMDLLVMQAMDLGVMQEMDLLVMKTMDLGVM